MINKQALMGEIVAAGYTQKQLADAIGIGLSSLSAKINGHRAFDTIEIAKICSELKITNKNRIIDIFFNQSVPKTGQGLSLDSV